MSMEKGHWVKAALHCHTLNSDGLLSPENVVEFYRSRGYGVIAITDHGKITRVSKYHDILLLPSTEISIGRSLSGEPFHVLGINIEDEIFKARNVQEVIDIIKELKGIAIIAHPYWSSLGIEELISLKNYLAIEVYNGGCDIETSKGFSSIYWDVILSNKKMVYGIAVDDSHRYIYPPIDADTGWIWIELNDFNDSNFYKAFINGRFYSSMGPKLYFLNIDSNWIESRFTPSKRVNIVSNNGKGLSIDITTIRSIISLDKEKKSLETIGINRIDINNEGETTKIWIEGNIVKGIIQLDNNGITYIKLNSSRNERYIRLEIIDNNGRYAWSNPIFLQ
ncbi:PHP domain protein [Ignisphaera aggregans DSM 17230]|uniref:PHP domain protein n=1 Tax=Ignisphaera aggregans (strain DSM 17230 / JCM 13409 / AQ1.S1) TaxID=583356 RepID=E0SR45_IGNAA|nr:PHP domain protein [Ignisphaera aggregans DSM 17230]